VRERDIAAISRHPSRCSDAVARNRWFVSLRRNIARRGGARESTGSRGTGKRGVPRSDIYE
jgi:hypothetical protein